MIGLINLFAIMVTCLFFACDDNSINDKRLPDFGDDIEALTGRVHSTGNGLAGVVVTDGHNFDVTDEYGYYSLPFSQLATHVYISSPAGYKVPVEKSVPQFYIELKNHQDKENIDFDLIPIGVPDEKHYFIGASDPQVRNEEEIRKLTPILEHMRDYIIEHNLNPVHVMVAGDIVFDQYHLHDASKAAHSLVNKPVYYAIGNHDHLLNRSEPASIEYNKISDLDYIEHYGPTKYSFNRGQVHYMVLDNILFKGGPNTEYDIFLTEGQLSWAKQNLSYVPKEKAVVVMVHSPTKTPFTEVFGNSQELWDLLQGYANVQLISGHTHYHSTVVHHSGIIEHIIGAMSGGWWEGPVCRCGTPLGYKVFEADGTDITWRYVAYEFSEKQFTVHPPGPRDPRLRPAEELLVNVWDWDPEWIVSWSADGGHSYEPMTRIASKTYDPTAVHYFGLRGDNAVPMRSWINAITTDHIFRATPAPDTNSAKIRVINRFGEEFVEQVDW